jgi:hypothetical protein
LFFLSSEEESEVPEGVLDLSANDLDRTVGKQDFYSCFLLILANNCG